MNISVILAGAVAKGAFEAGALHVIAERGIRVRRIVASSSGALNGTAYAAGVRACRERQATAELVDLWRERGNWGNAIHPNFLHLLGGNGLADSSNLLNLLRTNVRPCRHHTPAPIDLRIVVSPLNGVDGNIGDARATTYEKPLLFKDSDFDSEEGLERVFNAAVASAAFPGVFAPVDVPGGVGPCLDGGVVNNTPVDYALDEGSDATIEAVVVIAPTPEIMPDHDGKLAGLDLLSRLVDVLINERLYRDLREAERINEIVVGLREIARQRGWDADEIEKIKEAVGLGGKRRVQLVRIRPLAPLPGNAFTGFVDRGARVIYLEAGRDRASAVLNGLGW